MADDEIKFIDGENFRNTKSDTLTFRQIILNQVSRITQLASKEFHGGYYNEKIKMIDSVPTTTKTYNEDTREQYKNSILCLYDLMIAKFDDAIKADIKAFESEKESTLKEINGNKEISDETAKNRLAMTYRLLFQALIKLLDRKDYLQDESYEE